MKRMHPTLLCQIIFLVFLCLSGVGIGITAFVTISIEDTIQEDQYDHEQDALRTLKDASVIDMIAIQIVCLLGFLAIGCRSLALYYLYLTFAGGAYVITLIIAVFSGGMSIYFDSGCADIEDCFMCEPPEDLDNGEIDIYCTTVASDKGNDCYYLNSDYDSVCSNQAGDVSVLVGLMFIATTFLFLSNLWGICIKSKLKDKQEPHEEADHHQTLISSETTPNQYQSTENTFFAGTQQTQNAEYVRPSSLGAGPPSVQIVQAPPIIIQPVVGYQPPPQQRASNPFEEPSGNNPFEQ